MSDDKVVRLTPEEVEKLNELCPAPMGGFMDGTCPKCKKRFGWTGRVVDRPACPKCGHKVDLSELESDEREIKDFENLLRANRRRREEEDD